MPTCYVRFVRAFYFLAQPHPIQVGRMGSSNSRNSCNGTSICFLFIWYNVFGWTPLGDVLLLNFAASLKKFSGLDAYRAIGGTAEFWLEFYLPSSSCSQSLSFSWNLDWNLLAEVVPVKESDNFFNSTLIITNISKLDYGQYSFKVSGQTLQTFFLIPVSGK